MYILINKYFSTLLCFFFSSKAKKKQNLKNSTSSHNDLLITISISFFTINISTSFFITSSSASCSIFFIFCPSWRTKQTATNHGHSQNGNQNQFFQTHQLQSTKNNLLVNSISIPIYTINIPTSFFITFHASFSSSFTSLIP